MLVTTYLINHGAIQVNDQGLRFGDETDSYAGHALAVQAQPGRSRGRGGPLREMLQYRRAVLARQGRWLYAVARLVGGHDRGAQLRNLPQLVMKESDDLKNLIAMRISDHKKAEAERLEHERERIRKEEQERIEAS